MNAPEILANAVSVSCVDGRSLRIPEWLHKEFHLNPYILGLRDDPFGTEGAGTPLEKVARVRISTFDCVELLGGVATEIAKKLDLLRAARRVKK